MFCNTEGPVLITDSDWQTKERATHDMDKKNCVGSKLQILYQINCEHYTKSCMIALNVILGTLKWLLFR